MITSVVSDWEPFTLLATDPRLCRPLLMELGRGWYFLGYFICVTIYYISSS